MKDKLFFIAGLCGLIVAIVLIVSVWIQIGRYVLDNPLGALAIVLTLLALFAIHDVRIRRGINNPNDPK